MFTPKWAKVDGNIICVNPTEELLRDVKSTSISPEEAIKKYQEEILRKLSLVGVYELINLVNKHSKKDLALLCYEKPGEICHRRFIAEWLEKGTSIILPEFTVISDQLSLI